MSAQNLHETPQPQGFEDILAILPSLPPLGLGDASAARVFCAQYGLDEGKADLYAWLAASQNQFPPRLQRPRLTLFAAHHAAPPSFDSDYSQAEARVQALVSASDELCQLAVTADADLRLYELNLSQPVCDSSTEAAMGEGEATGVLVYGMTAAEVGLNLLVLEGIGAGSLQAAATVLAAMGERTLAAAYAASFGGLAVPEATVAFHQSACEGLTRKPLEILRRVSGRETGAILGAIIAARMGRLPVILTGAAALSAAVLLHGLDKRALQHCLYAADSTEPVAETRALCERIGLLFVHPDAAKRAGTAGPAAIILLRDLLDTADKASV